MKVLMAAILVCGAANASLLPMAKLNPEAVRAYDAYVRDYDSSGKLWMDSQAQLTEKPAAAVIAEKDVPGGQIHHTVGAIRIPGATIESVHAQLQNYAAYQAIYRPDVVKSSAELLPDSTPEKQHYRVSLRLVQSTLWVVAGFEGIYDSHYEKLSPSTSLTRSRSISIRELKDAKDPSQGTYAEGEDHGFLWRTGSWWHARERAGGVDLELTNISLTKPPPTGAGWWASRKSKQTVENLLNQTRAAVQAAAPRP